MIPPLVSGKARHIRARWAAYLAEIIRANDVLTTGTVARELIPAETRTELATLRSPGIHMQNASPRARVRRWLNGAETIRAESAYKVGEALRRLGAPRTSGVVALFAAGFYPEVTELLVRLSQLRAGAWPAFAYYISLDQWLHRWIERDVEWTDEEFHVTHTLEYDPDDERIKAAKIIAQSAIESAVAIELDAWQACDGGRNLKLWARKAILMATFESEDDSEYSFELAWKALKPWAEELYRRFGGPSDPFFSPRIRLAEYAPPLEKIAALIPLDPNATS